MVTLILTKSFHSTRPLLASLRFFSWHSSHSSLKGSSASLKTLAYFLLASLIILVLWPLKSKRATDVAMQILDIFLLFGAPNILQSDNGAEFTVSQNNKICHIILLNHDVPIIIIG
jgi:hypothetical protein